MIILPERIYEEYVRFPDTRVRYYGEAVQNTSAAAALSLAHRAPIDYDLHVTRVLAVATAGAAQTVSNCFLYLQRTPSVSELLDLYLIQKAVPVQKEIINEDFSGLIIPAGGDLGFFVNYSAGAAPNVINLTVHGILLPRMEFVS